MPLLALMISLVLALISHPLPALPSPSPAIQPASPTLPLTSPAPSRIAAPKDSGPWGVAQKIGEHTYRIKVQNDTAMGPPAEILSALNTLRARHGAQALKTDPRLCNYTKKRAEYQNSLGQTDGHAGFEDFLQNQDGFHQLGYGRIGENSSYGYIMSGVHLIEFVYMQSPEHNANQLNPDWDHGCVGVSGQTTNFIFATSPL